MPLKILLQVLSVCFVFCKVVAHAGPAQVIAQPKLLCPFPVDRGC